MMASIERDNTTSIYTTYTSQERRPSWDGTKLTNVPLKLSRDQPPSGGHGVMSTTYTTHTAKNSRPSREGNKYTDRPITFNRDRYRTNPWETRRTRDSKAKANAMEDTVAPGASGAKPTARWMSSGTGMGLTEAFERTNENGDFIPRTKSAMSENDTLTRNGSTDSFEIGAEPPLNIPRRWGSKAKKYDALVKRMLSPQATTEIKESIAVPTDQPNASLWDADLDFTAQSLQISTSPKLQVRKANSEAPYTSTSSTSPSRRAKTDTKHTYRRPEEQPEVTNSRGLEKVPWEYRSILEEEGEKIHGTPITVFSARDYDAYVQRNGLEGKLLSTQISSRSSSEESHDALRRLSRSLSTSPAPHKKAPDVLKEENDSKAISRFDIRRRLSSRKEEEQNSGQSATRRSSETRRQEDEEPQTSNTPRRTQPDLVAGKHKSSESAKHPETALLEEPPRSSMNLKVLEAATIKEHSIPSGANSGKHPESSEPEDPEARIAAEARLFEPQDKSDKGSIRAPSPFYDGIDDTPRPKPDPLSLPTPKVTGAYIETPLVRKSRTNPFETTLHQPTPRFKDARPALINTAKRASAAEDVRRIQLEENPDDTTLEAFGALLEAEAAAASEGHTTTIEPEFDLKYNEQGLPLSKKEIESRLEEVAMTRINQKLKATTTSLRDARKGVERLEEQISAVTEIPVSQAQPANDRLDIHLHISIPKLWKRQTLPESHMTRGWKFTWLGLILASFALWFVAESAMCAQFCHPENSRYNTWQPSDPFFPWAIPTKLDQWTGGYAGSALDKVVDSLGLKDLDILGIPTLPKGYKGGPTANDWWLGRSGPVGILHKIEDSFDDDEMSYE